jgi:hypothetical protein
MTFDGVPFIHAHGSIRYSTMGRRTCEWRAVAAARGATHARSGRYTLCSSMQRHFPDAVVPVLGMQHAGKDTTNALLERCIRDVRPPGARRAVVPCASRFCNVFCRWL